MFSKLLVSLLLVALSISTASCSGAPKSEIQQAIQQSLDFNGEIPIISVQKAPNPEFYPSGFSAPPEAVWCVRIDTSTIPVDPIRMGPNPTDYLVTKQGLLYSVGMYGNAAMFSREMGCSNF